MAGPAIDPGTAGIGEPYRLPIGIDYQRYQYGTPGDLTSSSNVYQQYGYTSAPAMTYRHGPGAVAIGEGPMSTLALDVAPGTCMWECTAAYTPYECRQLCQ